MTSIGVLACALAIGGDQPESPLLGNVGKSRIVLRSHAIPNTPTPLYARLSRDGHRLITADMDGDIMVYDFPSARRIRTIPSSHPEMNAGLPEGALLRVRRRVHGLSIGDNGRFIACPVDGVRGYDYVVLDSSTGELVFHSHSNSDFLWQFAISPDGAMAIGASIEDGDGNSSRSLVRRVWELPSGRQVAQIQTKDVPAAQGVYCGNSFASIVSRQSGERCVEIRRLPSFDVLARIGSSTTSVGAYSDELIAWASSSRNRGQPRYIEIVDAATLTSIGRINVDTDSICNLEFSSDGNYLAAASCDGRITVWDVATQSPIGVFVSAERIWSIALNTQMLSLVVGVNDKSAIVWSLLPESTTSLADRRLDDLWNDLLLRDKSATAFQAICELVRRRETAVAFLAKRVQPATLDDTILRHIRQLDSDSFKERELGSKRLLEIGQIALPAIRHSLRTSESTESLLRLRAIVENLTSTRNDGGAINTEALRAKRAIQVLERIGSDDAISILRQLGGGASESPLTRSALDAILRLKASEASRS